MSDAELSDFTDDEPVQFREWHNVEAEREARERMPGGGDE